MTGHLLTWGCPVCFCSLMQRRIKLIANPVSGGDARPHIARAQRFLEKNGAEVDLYLTGQRGDATAEAADFPVSEYDLVIAAGGDGTLNEVANGLAGRGVPLAFLPLGTANVMAIEMGVPLDIEAACSVALAGQARPVVMARAGQEFFLMMAGLGFDAAAVRAVNPGLKRLLGKGAYLVAGLNAFFRYRPVPLQLVTAEGLSLTVWHVIVSNIRCYGGRFVMAPAAGLEQPGLVACVIDRPGRFALLLFWVRILLRDKLLGQVRRLESDHFDLSGAVVPVQIDGDDVGNSPLHISCHSDLIELIFPPST